MAKFIEDSNKETQFGNKNVIFYLIIIVLCTIVLLPSFKNGFFGDDYSWILQARESMNKNLGTIFFEPAPYEYFRPVPKIVFVFLWNLFPLSPLENERDIIYYRLLVLLIHILTSFVIYELIKYKFNSTIAFLTACFFSVIACHSETLYSINCLNELLASLFLLTGLLLFVKANYIFSLKVLLSIFFFLLAVLSRESAFCFIPLIFLFSYNPIRKEKSINNEKCDFTILKKTIIITIIIIIYISLRYVSYRYYSELYNAGNFGVIDTNPLRYVYKIFHYLINIIFPVKSIFYIIGFENFENLRKAFLNPGENVKLFTILILSSIVILSITIYLIYQVLKSQKIRKNDILNSKFSTLVFPLLFTIFALVVYLPLEGTAERFLYLPSVGICLLFALIFTKTLYKYEKLNSRIFVVVIMILVIGIYTLSIYQRADIWGNASSRTKLLLSKVAEKIQKRNIESDISLEDKNSRNKIQNVLMLEIPTIEKGTYFVNQYNFNHIWKFYYPDQKIKFWFYNNPENVKIDLIFSFKELNN